MNERELPPDVILDTFSRWQQRQIPRATMWRATDAMWRTSYLSDNMRLTTGRYEPTTSGGAHWSEPNSIYPFLIGYVAAMADANLEAKVTRGSDLKGDARKAQLYLNEWIKSPNVNFDLILQEIDTLAFAYDGAAAMVTLDADQPDVLDRVGLLVIPCWEVFPDADVTNVRQQRFIGYHYWMPVVQARRLFQDSSLVGSPRPGDPYVNGATIAAASPGSAGLDNVVHVLEVFNLVDPYHIGESDQRTGMPIPGFIPAEDCATTRGRREWYTLSEGPKTARLVRALPYSTPSGKPLTPMPFLTYLHQIGFPNQGLAHVDRVFDPMREKMELRSRQVTNVKNQVPHFAYPAGMFDEAALDIYNEGKIGGMAYDPKSIPEEGSPSASVFPMPSQNIVYDNVTLGQALQNDLDRSTIQGPAKQGRAVDISATQSLQLDETARSETNLLWSAKKAFLVQIFQAVLAAGRAALRAGRPGAVINVVEGVGDEEIVTEITVDDLDGGFKIEVTSGEPTQLAEERAIRRMLELTAALKPLADAALKGDKVAAVLYDDIVRKSRIGKKYLLENFRQITEGTVDSGVQVPRGAGAGSALPGQGSTPVMTPGGPQPAVEQPADNQTGVAQNTTGAT